MSYILDALKKSQAEQHADLASLGYAQQKIGAQLNPWIIAIIVVVLVANAGVLTWVMLGNSGNNDASGRGVAQTANEGASLTPASGTSGQVPIVRTPEPLPKRTIQPPPKPSVTQEPEPIVIGPNTGNRIATPVQSAQTDDGFNEADMIVIKPGAGPSKPLASEVTPAQSSASSPSASNEIETISLSDLPEAQRLRYNALTYSAHTFSPDEPDISYLVINGERLGIGDNVVGLTVVALTVDGVIFAETTPDGVRHVEVSVIEQWAREG